MLFEIDFDLKPSVARSSVNRLDVAQQIIHDYLLLNVRTNWWKTNLFILFDSSTQYNYKLLMYLLVESAYDSMCVYIAYLLLLLRVLKNNVCHIRVYHGRNKHVYYIIYFPPHLPALRPISPHANTNATGMQSD